MIIPDAAWLHAFFAPQAAAAGKESKWSAASANWRL
jgi:hypothetical protein